MNLERWRKGSFLNPFCHLVLKAVRVDSPPFQNPQSLAELLTEYRHQSKLTREELAMRLGVSLGSLTNWERGRTRPSKAFWAQIRSLKMG
jgi:DNA-binding transcriptional regulator YiaG